MAYRKDNFSASQKRSSRPDFYAEKTSAEGHYEPKDTYKSGFTTFKWVEHSTPKAAPAAAAAPPPKEQSMAIEPVKHSPEIQQAKSRVNQYENKYKQGESPWEQAQANVQSSFIKSSDSSVNNKQYDFASNNFNANESTKPNEKAQAAQNQLQNYVSKYSEFKSSS